MEEQNKNLPAVTNKLYFPSESEQALTCFTPDIVEGMLQHIKTIGMSLRDCAALYAIPERRVNSWYKQNYCNFKFAAEAAVATFKKLHLSRLSNAKDRLKVNSSQWLLERKFKSEFSKEITLTVNSTLHENYVRIANDVLTKFIKDPEELRKAAIYFADRLKEVRLEDLPPDVNVGS